MNGCPRIRVMLSAYADRELTGEEMYHVRNHISTCPECHKELDQLLEVKRAVASIAIPTVSDGMLPRLKAATIREPKRPLDRRGVAIGLSFALSLMVLTFAIMQWLSVSQQSPQTGVSPVQESAYASDRLPIQPRSIPVTLVNAPE